MNLWIKYCSKCGKPFDRGINEKLCQECKKKNLIKKRGRWHE